MIDIWYVITLLTLIRKYYDNYYRKYTMNRHGSPAFLNKKVHKYRKKIEYSLIRVEKDDGLPESGKHDIV